MDKAPKKPRGGKKPIPIEPERVEKIAALGATNTEIADVFGVNTVTIVRRFQKELTKGRATVKLRLRQLQWQAAEGGNVTMQIWLGKNMLGQTDSPMVEITNVSEKPDRKAIVARWREQMGQVAEVGEKSS